ncbi:MAG: cation diffusion facilitator family transporter [Syntrophales bacterium]
METSAKTSVAFYSVLLNFMVAATKGILTFLSGSAALLADTIHGISDLVESIVVLIGIRISAHESPEFPLGLYKVENFAALVCSGAIFFAAYEMIEQNLLRRETHPLSNVPVSAAVLIVISLVIFAFMKFEDKKGDALNSPAIKADAQHWWIDIVSTLVVLGGVSASWLGFHFIDKVAALLVTFVILKSGWNILVDSTKSLLDASVDRETLDRIRNAITEFPEVDEIKSITARNSGSYIFCRIELSLALKSLKKAHEVSERIESSIKKAVPHVDRIIIHYEPVTKKYLTFAVPLQDRQGTIFGHFGEAPYIALIRKTGGKLEQETLENPFAAQEKGKGINLAEYLVVKGIDVLFSREPLGKGPEHVFGQAEAEIRLTDKKRLTEIMDELVD